MSDVCQYCETDVPCSSTLHEWDIPVGGGAVRPVPPKQIESVGHLVFTLCETHAAMMEQLPTLSNPCTCRICGQ